MIHPYRENKNENCQWLYYSQTDIILLGVSVTCVYSTTIKTISHKLNKLKFIQ